MFNAAMVMKMKLALVAPAVIKNSLPKNPFFSVNKKVMTIYQHKKNDYLPVK